MIDITTDIIKNWSIPPCLKDMGLKFIFNNDDLPNNAKNYIKSCEGDNIFPLSHDKMGIKFCLYDSKNNNVVFTMHFDLIQPELNRLSSFLVTEPYIKLEIINTNDDSLRRKGIASYYISKLIEFAIENKISKISIHPDNRHKTFIGQGNTNKKSNEELKIFYKKFQNDKVKIEFR